VYAQHSCAIRNRRTADHHRGDVDGQKTTAVKERRQAEREKREREREHGVEPTGRELGACEQRAAAVSNRNTEHGAKPKLDHHVEEEPPAGLFLRDEEPRERHRKQHRHRVVEPRLELERHADTLLQLDAAATQHREHGGGVRG
jgi:hypothetical protein